MNILSEDSIDTQKVYFHGSKSAKKTAIDKPSCRYPFYITSDLHYAMAFATKGFSSVGGNRHIDYGSSGYVYVISINSRAKVYDFRRDSSSGFPVFSKIFPKNLIEVVMQNFDSPPTDIYDFSQAMLSYFWPIRANEPVSRCSSEFKQHMDEFISYYDANNLDDYIDDEGECHSFMEFIFEKLDDLNYDGIITSEQDLNLDTNTKTTTDYAIGLWNAAGFSISGAPLKYSLCKKINPTFIDNYTSESAILKA